MRRILRFLGLSMVILGGLTLVWAVVVWRWEDPFTALYTMYEQHELRQAYDRRVDQFDKPAPSSLASRAAHKRAVAHADAAARKKALREALQNEQRLLAAAARRYRLSSHEGDPLGRIIVPRLGLNMIFLDGTSESSLEKGPGRDLQTYMPGEGRLVYIAGHRTTFLAPFSNINLLRRGDRITVQLPYGTFIYSVTRHIIVAYNDLAVLKSGKTETLALQACHPRFFATHRYIVYAKPVEVIPRPAFGAPYAFVHGQVVREPDAAATQTAGDAVTAMGKSGQARS